jgi:hypothetical protein
MRCAARVVADDGPRDGDVAALARIELDVDRGTDCGGSVRVDEDASRAHVSRGVGTDFARLDDDDVPGYRPPRALAEKVREVVEAGPTVST